MQQRVIEMSLVFLGFARDGNFQFCIILFYAWKCELKLLRNSVFPATNRGPNESSPPFTNRVLTSPVHLLLIESSPPFTNRALMSPVHFLLNESSPPFTSTVQSMFYQMPNKTVVEKKLFSERPPPAPPPPPSYFYSYFYTKHILYCIVEMQNYK